MRLVILRRFGLLLSAILLGAFPLIAASTVEVADQCKPSVVQIITQDGSGQDFGLGSGFVIGPELVATCFHVVDGAAGGQVKTIDKIVYPITAIVAFDIPHDLAILRVKKLDIPPLALADSDAAKDGEQVIAIGSPLGLEGAAVTDGIVSATREYDDRGKVIQVSSPVSPGNSGGPLLNNLGQVIGVVSFGLVEGQNINFGIPANMLAELHNTEDGKECDFRDLPKRNPDDITPDEAKTFGLCASCEAALIIGVPKKAPYTVAPFGTLLLDPASITVSTISGKKGREKYTLLDRVADETQLQDGSFFFTPTGVLKLTKEAAGKNILVSFRYQPQRVAIWIPHDEEKIRAADYLEKKLRLAGYETLRGAEVDSVMKQQTDKGDIRSRVLAKRLDCAYLIKCDYTFRFVEDGWSDFFDAYMEWDITAEVQVTMYNLATKSIPLDTSSRGRGSVGKIGKVDHFRRDLVYSCLDHILGNTMIARVSEDNVTK